MGLGEIWFQTQRDPELRNTFDGVLLCQEHPTQKIVSLGATGRELYNLFECGPSLPEVTAVQGRQTLAIRHLGLVEAVLRLRECEICKRDQERRQQY